MNPKVFISYSWDNEDHKSWIRVLGEKLQQNGVLTNIDQWNVHPGIDLPNYMETSIRDADYVILVCTPNYSVKANLLKGGVGYEKMVVTGEIFANSSAPKKFVPIIRLGTPQESLPSYLKSKLFIDFRDNASFDKNFTKLLRHIFEEPEFKAPVLGERPSTFPLSNDSQSSNRKVFCTKCGSKPGSYSSCISSSNHDYVIFEMTVYCSKCGAKPGTYSSCIGSEFHNYLSFQGNIFCSKCGTKPGSYSSCISSQPHDFRAYK